jgi:hypothetical protein
MVSYSKFDVIPVRATVRAEDLGWPEPGEAHDDSGLGCNRLYADLRHLSWTEAKRVYDLETLLIARVDASEDPEDEWRIIEDDLFEESDHHLYGLDLGVAATVVALSAARCVPFASCNAGAFGGRHHERYPLVAFFSRPQMLDLLLASATAADAGLEVGDHGALIAYANDVRVMRRLAVELIDRRAAFRTVRLRPPKHGSQSTQLSFFC